MSGERNDAREILIRTDESLHIQYQGYRGRISFVNDIISDQVRNPGEQRLHCNIKKCKKGQFGILYDISENVTLV